MSVTITLLTLALSLVGPHQPAAVTAASREGCNVHICSQEYAAQQQRLDSLKSPAAGHSSHSSPATSSSSSTTAAAGVLYNSDLYNAQARQEESVEKCSLLLGYNQCMKSLAKSCKGNIEFHSVLAVVRKLMQDANCNGSYHRTRQGIKSGIEYKREQELRKKPHESKRLKRCLNEVYNYTFDHENYMARMESMRYNKQLQQHIANRQSPLEDVFASSVTGPVKRRSSSSRSKRSGGNSEADAEDCDMPSDDPLAESPMSSEFANLFEKDDEPLMCSLFGDPHVRTFENNFMTCRCLGAWPMVDHPLFAVQVTSNQAEDAAHLVSGVTKVTVLIREFRVCGIETDLIYEVDLLDLTKEAGPNADLPATFTDGMTATSNSLVKVTARSGGNVCVQMDHVNVQICVYRLPFTSYLNVIVKFKKVMDSDERERMIDSMDAASLCSRGCPDQEQVRVEAILEAIGVDPATTFVEECRDLHGYYYIYCLYDVKMKGVQINETFVHRFAQDMDDILVVKRNFARTHVSPNSAPEGSRKPKSQQQLLILLLTSILITNLIQVT